MELRLDTVADPDVAGALQGRSGPVIVTCRAAWEGGYFKGTEEARLGLLEQAWHAGADFVDIEFAAWREAAWVRQTGGERLVVSSHDFAGMPADLAARYRAMAATGAAVVKLAVTATRPGRLRAAAGASSDGAAAPGRAGDGRARPDHAAAAAAIRVGLDLRRRRRGARADAARQLREEFRFGEVGADAALYGIVANPVGHSVSPAMHNAAHRADDRNAVYLPLQAVDAADVLAFAEAFDVRGAQRHAAVQGRPAPALRTRRARHARGRGEHAGRVEVGRGADSTPTCRACSRRWPSVSTWRACARPSSARAARRAAPPSRCRARARA